MSASLEKLDGVTSVEVSLEKGIVDIALAADNTVTLPELRRTIRSNGIETKDAQVEARGRVLVREGTPIVDLLNGSTMELKARPARTPRGIAEIQGVSTELTKDTERLEITRIR